MRRCVCSNNESGCYMNSHTDGPWKYGEFPLSDSGNIYIWNQDETILVGEVSTDDADSHEAKANAAN